MPTGIYLHKKASEGTRKKLSLLRLGRGNPFYKKQHTDDAKEKNRKAHLGLTGERHPQWKGGISKHYKEGYSSFEYKKWRIDIFLRDNFTCQFCGIRGVYLTAHHIKSWAKYPELRFDVNNGVTLCEECHKLTDNYKGRNNNKILK